MGRQLFGMAIAIMGMVVVLWQPDAHIFGSPGEWMILASTVVVVFGNRCGKAVLTVLEPVEVLMIRSFCTGIIMIVASSFLAPSPVLSSLSSHIWLIIGAQTVFILILSKIFWYSALRRLRLVQAASFLPLSPFFAFIASALLLGERPTLFQIIGLLCIIAGLVLITTLYGERKSV
jgi:drug/metabolite transporter (DMT)-like permease